MNAPVQIEPLQRMGKDIRNAAATISGRAEIRFLVDGYYQMQDQRIRSGNQIKSMEDTQEPHQTIQFIMSQMGALENQIKGALQRYAEEDPLGKWLLSIRGIGPVIAAGLIAHVDLDKTPGVANLWRYAGLDPTVDWQGSDKNEKWIREQLKEDGVELDETFVHGAAGVFGRNPEKLYEMATHDFKTGEECPLTVRTLAVALARRPWNSSLKRLCYLMGECFVKSKLSDERREKLEDLTGDDTYYRLYASRKAYETANNKAGKYADKARHRLDTMNYSADTNAKKALMKGELPLAALHERSKRKTVKIFLSHYYQMAYLLKHGVDAPEPYAMAILGHKDKIDPPNQHIIRDHLKAQKA
jgi:hypothetical protein